ncbi:MAG: hypothetical protein ACRD68_10980, partial [Pyrinomonadaceae bacterium]
MKRKFETRVTDDARRKQSASLMLGLGALLLGLVALPSCARAAATLPHERYDAIPPEAQETLTGQWAAEVKPNSEDVHLSIQRRHERGGMSQSSSNIPLSALKGIGR